MRVVTCAQMKQIEKNAAAGGLSYTQMMENAGARAVDRILQDAGLEGREGNAFILAGKGNNAGDGFVAARLLTDRGLRTVVLLAGGEPSTGDARLNFAKLFRLPVIILRLPQDLEQAQNLAMGSDIMIDALYGTGFHGKLGEMQHQAIALLHQSQKPVYALDIPSGVNADTGEADPGAVKATATIAFDSLKPGHLQEPGKTYCGRLFVEDIGIPEECHQV